MNNLKPLADRVVIKPFIAEEKLSSGIFIPDVAKEQRSEGEIISIGTGIKDGKKYEFSVKEGDKVVYSKYSGEDIKIDGIDYKVMQEEEILGIIN